MEYGEKQWMVETYEARGLPLPEWAVLRPEVPYYLSWIWDSFWELGTCRSFDGGSPKSIPWTAIKEYVVYHEIDFDYFHRIIRSLDDAYVSFMCEQLRKESEKSRSAGKKPPRSRR